MGDIPYIQISIKITSCHVSLLKRGGPKCPTLYGFSFLYLKHDTHDVQSNEMAVCGDDIMLKVINKREEK